MMGQRIIVIVRLGILPKTVRSMIVLPTHAKMVDRVTYLDQVISVTVKTVFMGTTVSTRPVPVIHARMEEHAIMMGQRIIVIVRLVILPKTVRFMLVLLTHAKIADRVTYQDRVTSVAVMKGFMGANVSTPPVPVVPV